ncbi:hypothetical protein KQI63_14350 [bacterium]|nr:hypothetical protein [bacterium]
MDDPPRRKIRITDRDPYVYQRARAEAARFHVEREKARQKKMQDRACGPEKVNEGRRRQSLLLSLMFAALAFFIWIGTQLAGPKLLVTVNGAEGTVLLDSVAVGPTNEVLRVPSGNQVVTIRFDDPRYKPEPLMQPVKTGFGLKPYEVSFTATLPLELDSAGPDSADYHD